MKNTLKTLLICTLTAALLVSCNSQKGGEESTTTTTTNNSVSGTTPDADTSTGSSNPDPSTPDSSASDSTEVKTPEEICAAILASQDNLKYEMSNVADGFSVSSLFSIDGNKTYSLISYEFFGMSQSEENYFVVEEGDEPRYTYYYQEEGSWYKYSFEEGDDTEEYFPVDFDDLDVVFKTENFGEFDSTTNRYPMLEGVVIEDSTITSGYLEITDNGYTVEFVIIEEDIEVTTRVLFYDFGKVSITLPDAEEAAPDSVHETSPIWHPETAPSPEEIYDQIENADNISIDLYSVIGEQTVSLFMEQDENLIWAIISIVSGEYSYMDEVYLEKDGDTVYRYREDENGNWSREEADFEEYVMDDSVISELLKTENFEEYDPESGEYVLKDGKTVVLDDLGTVTFASIAVDNDGSYFIYLTVEGEDGEMVEYTFSYYDFGTTEIDTPFENAVG